MENLPNLHVPTGPQFDSDPFLQGVRMRLNSYHTEYVHVYEPAKIMLPMLFSIDAYDSIGSTVMLVDPVGNQFEVVVKKKPSRVYLTQGTERIGQYYKLFHGGWLTFIYISERTLVMEVRDRLGEHVVYPTPPCVFLIGNSSNPIDVDDEKLKVHVQSMLTKLDECFHHSLIKTLSESDVSTDFLNIDVGFLHQSVDPTTSDFQIVDDAGKVWPCKLVKEGGSVAKWKLTSGWLKFCSFRGLKAGTTVRFGVPNHGGNQIYFKLF